MAKWIHNGTEIVDNDLYIEAMREEIHLLRALLKVAASALLPVVPETHRLAWDELIESDEVTGIAKTVEKIYDRAKMPKAA